MVFDFRRHRAASRLRLLPGSATFAVLLLLAANVGATPASTHPLAGLRQPARIVWDTDGVAHIYAQNHYDLSFLLGYAHARDRFFQMDSRRRLFAGRLAELLGSSSLQSDIEYRTFGLERAAEETWAALDLPTKLWLLAYAAGVNSYLQDHPLPPQYAALELTSASIPAWRPVDSVLVEKGVSFELSFRLDDLDRSLALSRFREVGQADGFDGDALFFQDLYRSAPADDTVSVPASPATRLPASLPSTPAHGPAGGLTDRGLLERFRQGIAADPLLAWTLSPSADGRGSNWWAVSGRLSRTGQALLASDPHLAINSPATFIEAHLVLEAPGTPHDLNAYGVSFPGVPGFAVGCNLGLCWGFTIDPVDVTDIYQERLVLDPASGWPSHSLFRGAQEPLVVLPQHYRVNQGHDGVPDHLEDSPVGPLAGGRTFVVPRRNRGPLVSLNLQDPAHATGLSVQYTGWRATHELEGYRLLLRATDWSRFRQALNFFDTGSMNFVAADRKGLIAYWASGEIPLREDLQNLGRADGLPPFFVRDGSGAAANEWLPKSRPQPFQALEYEILPASELPHAVKPAVGFLLNANNDPVGTTLDNDPLDQPRPGGGIFYLDYSYTGSLRAGRIRRLLEKALAAGSKVSVADMERFQANNQLLDAELLMPTVLAAFDHAEGPGAKAALARLAADPRVAEAIGRWRSWDFSSPTGLREGFDPGDDPKALAEPGPGEVRNSVAATLWSVWRGRMLIRTLDGVLDRHGLSEVKPDGEVAWTALMHHLTQVASQRGVGASGLRLIPLAPGSSKPEDGRDWVILQSLADTLDLLAGDAFGPAFHHSTRQDDYRWGALHRIVLDNPLGSRFEIPPGAGLQALSPTLPGIPRGGGFEVVDASTHNLRGSRVNRLMFSTGAAIRLVAALGPEGVEAFSALPGGASEVPGNPFQGDQLPLWLSHRYHPVRITARQVEEGRFTSEEFTPAL